MEEKIAEHLDAIERVASTINGDAAVALSEAVNGIREALAELSPAEQRLIELDEAQNTFDFKTGQFPDGTPLPKTPWDQIVAEDGCPVAEFMASGGQNESPAS